MKWYNWTGLIVVVLALAFIAIPNGEVEQTNTAFANDDMPGVPFATSPILSSGGVEKTESNSLTETQEELLMGTLDNWEQNGSEVYFEDERVYISAEDNTNSPIIRLMSKQYGGDINIAFGFDTQEIKPTWAGYNRHIESQEKTYTCTESFNYTLSPKHFWCYKEYIFTNSTPNYHEPIFDHSFDSGNIPLQTATWYEDVEVWNDVSGAFNKRTFFLNNTDTWYVKNNFNVNANQTYELKLNLQPQKINTPSAKYWIAFWPSSLTLQQAVAQDKFYALDPWTADLDTDLVAYYAFEEGSGTSSADSIGNYDLAGQNTPGWGTGIIGGATDLENSGADQYWLESTTSGDFAFNNSFTINVWVNPETQSQYVSIASIPIDQVTGGARWHVRSSSTANKLWGQTRTSAVDQVESSSTIGSGSWSMITYVSNSSGLYIYIDGVQDNQIVQSATYNAISEVNPVAIGAFYESSTWKYGWDGLIDEVGIWDAQLTPAQITQLYNGGSGITYQGDNAPSVELNNPVNNFNSTIPLVTFNATVNDDFKVQNVSLLIDGVIDQTNTSNVNGTYVFTKSLVDGLYNWSILAYDNNSQSNQSETRDFNVTNLVTFYFYNVTPANNSVLGPSDLIGGVLLFKWGILDELNFVNKSTFKIGASTTIYDWSIYGNLNGTLLAEVVSPSDGLKVINITATNNESDFITESYQFTYDSTPPVVTVSSPINYSDMRYDQESLTLNWTAQDERLSVCWYEYNNTNNTVSCGSNTTTFTYQYPHTNLTFYANDTVGNTASKFHDWNDLFYYGGESFVTGSVEGLTENFNLTVVSNGSLITSGRLIYNGTTYDAIVTSVNDTYNIGYSLLTPGVEVPTNYSFYFSITSQEGIIVNTELKYQFVSEVIITLCNGTEIPFVEFSARPVGDYNNVINATFKSTWNLAATDGGARIINYTFEDLTETNSSWAFCFSPVRDYYADTVIEIDSEGYAKNFYYLIDDLLTQTHANTSLYLLNDSLATLTEIEVLDEKQSPLIDVYNYIQLYDVGTDTFYTVAMTKSSFDGKDLTYLNWYDSLYKMIFLQDGEIIKTVTPFKVSESPKIFTIATSTTFGFEKFRDIRYNMYYNNATSNFILSFIKPSSITSGCLEVYKRNQTGDFEICNTCETSNSATLYCNVAAHGNGTFISRFYATGSFSDISTIFEYIGTSGILFDQLEFDDAAAMSFILSGIIASLFLITPVLGILGAILGLLASYALGFQALDYGVFIGIIIIGGIAAWAMKK